MTDETVNKMNPEWKAAWLEALRSGSYQQTAGRLRYEREDGLACYCCLGVLQEIARSSGVTIPERRLTNHLREDAAEEVLGLRFDCQDLLARMNDNGDSFAVIADYIEEHL